MPMPAQVIVTVDVVLLTLKDRRLQVALMKRPLEPFKSVPALPGGYVHAEEDADVAVAAYRVLRDKMQLRPPYLEQLGTFSGARRDPARLVDQRLLPGACHRGRRGGFPMVPGRQACHASPSTTPSWLRRRSRACATSQRIRPCRATCCRRLFTLSELQAIYSQMLGEPLEKSSFRRKLRDLDFLEEVPGAFQGGKQRPAQLYRLKGMALFDRSI
jgi:8-oxo-dGTP diphosphatase